MHKNHLHTLILICYICFFEKGNNICIDAEIVSAGVIDISVVKRRHDLTDYE